MTYLIYSDGEEIGSIFSTNKFSRIHPLQRHKTDSRVARQNEIEFEQKDIDEMNKTFGEDFKLYEEITK